MPQFGKTRSLDFTPVITAGAYSAGDSVGGENVIPEIGSTTRRGVLKSLVLTDNGNQKQPLTILVCKAPLATAPVDNDAFALVKADLPKIVAKINVAADDYETIGGKAVADLDISRTIEGEYTNRGPCRLWVYILTTGTPTYTSTSDLFVSLGFLAD